MSLACLVYARRYAKCENGFLGTSGFFSPRNERNVRQGAITPPNVFGRSGGGAGPNDSPQAPTRTVAPAGKNKTLTRPLQPPIRLKNGPVFCDASTLGSSLEVIAFEFQVIGYF